MVYRSGHHCDQNRVSGSGMLFCKSTSWAENAKALFTATDRAASSVSSAVGKWDLADFGRLSVKSYPYDYPVLATPRRSGDEIYHLCQATGAALRRKWAELGFKFGELCPLMLNADLKRTLFSV